MVQQFFTKEEPQQIHKITTPTNGTNSPTPDYNEDLGRSASGSSDGGMEWRSTRRVAHSIFKLPRTGAGPSHPSYLHMPVLTTTATASFAENWCAGDERNADHHHHHHHQARHGAHSETYFPRPYPPHNRDEPKEGSGRSPKIIRFREDQPDTERPPRMMARTVPPIEISPNESSKDYVESNDKKLQYETVQITPNPEYDHKNTRPVLPVSRRGGRGMGRGGGMCPVSVSRCQGGNTAAV